jgi:hypothetical protein
MDGAKCITGSSEECCAIWEAFTHEAEESIYDLFDLQDTGLVLI